jgi:hypothetical protein
MVYFNLSADYICILADFLKKSIVILGGVEN